MKNIKFLVFASISVFIFLIISGCNRKKDTIAKIYVKDSDKNPILNAMVILRAVPSENSKGKTIIVADTAFTNIAGEAIFNFNDIYKQGQAGVAVLNIYAFKDTLEGSGMIQIVEETVSEAKISMN